MDILFSNADFWKNVQSDGDDIRLHDGTQILNYYLSYFDYAQQKAFVMVEIPSLAADEIKTIHLVYGSASASSASDVGVAGIPFDGLAGWWPFDEGAGTIATDLSGNNYDGNIVGAS